MAKKKLPVKNHGHFIAVLLLFSGFSLYALTSFFSSTNDYLDNMVVSVVANPSAVVEEVSMGYVFTDVRKDYKYVKAIEALYSAGIIDGYEDGTFKPNLTSNRAEFLATVTTAVDADFGGKVLKNCFSDVKEDWYAPFVCYAKDAEWITGYGNGDYKPANPIRRAEALKIVFEAFNYSSCEEVAEEPYPDVTIDSWYAPYACAAKRDGIISKMGSFNSTSEVTRAHVADMIYKVMERKGLL